MNVSRALFFLVATFLLADAGVAQTPEPRYGLGFNTMVSSADGFGVGLRGRVSFPVNADFSAAADLGFTGYVLGGRDNAAYILDPQLSAIVMLPAVDERATYVLFGIGAYVPVGGDSDASGPTIHAGIGRAHLLQESSFFYEINPGLIIGEDNVDVAVPLRVGIIF